MHVPDGSVRDARGEPVLFRAGAGGVVAAQAGAADGDALGINVAAFLEPVNALADRHLVVVPRVHLVPAQRATLPWPIDHQDGDAALYRAASGHEPQLVFERIEAAERDQHRPGTLAFRLDEISGQRDTLLIGDADDLPRQVAQPLPARALASLEGRHAARVIRLQPEFRRAEIIRRAQPAVHGGANMPALLRLVAAPVIALGDHQPFAMPALQIGLHPARGLEAFAHRATALLRFAEGAAELVGQEEVLFPVMPAERFVFHCGT